VIGGANEDRPERRVVALERDIDDAFANGTAG